MPTWHMTLSESTPLPNKVGSLLSFEFSLGGMVPPTYLKLFAGASGYAVDAAAAPDGVPPHSGVIAVKAGSIPDSVVVWMPTANQPATVDLYRLDCSHQLYPGVQVDCYPLFNWPGTSPRVMAVRKLWQD